MNLIVKFKCQSEQKKRSLSSTITISEFKYLGILHLILEFNPTSLNLKCLKNMGTEDKNKIKKIIWMNIHEKHKSK